MTPHQFPFFADLGSLAEELGRNPKHQQLKAKINQAWRAQSCLGDLRRAMDCAAILRRMDARLRADDTPDLLTVESALMSTAISLYARATSTKAKSGDRGPIQLDKKRLTTDQIADHDVLIEIRNRAMAHVYSRDRIGELNWHTDICFAVEVFPGGWKAASATNQHSFSRITLDRLDRMLPIAHSIILERFYHRMAAVTDAINEGDIPDRIFRKHGFDPVEVFGNADAVARLLAGQKEGTAGFWAVDRAPHAT